MRYLLQKMRVLDVLSSGVLSPVTLSLMHQYYGPRQVSSNRNS